MDTRVTDGGSAAKGPALRRDVGFMGLLFASLGGIIGSGWLFGALYSAQTAGPAALLSWLIGAVAILLLALVYAELGSTFPLSGGVARFPQLTHGSLVSFTFGWIVWLGSVAVAPIEVEAAIQYASNYLPWLTHAVNGAVVLTLPGYGVAALLMAIFTVINLIGVRQFARANTGIGLWKLAIPILTFIMIMVASFHPGNLTAFGGFLPFGLKGILSAISTSGIIFSYLGFRQAVELAGESRNPKRNVPLAVILSVLVGAVVYTLLQLALLGAVGTGGLAKGWAGLTYPGHFGPFAGLATTLGVSWLAILLYIDAVVSPGGTGLIYTGTTGRVLYALARNRYLPRWLTRLNVRGVPLWGLLITFIVGMLVFLPFPGWQTLVGFISSAMVLSYGIGPIVLASLRRQQRDLERPFRLGGAGVWSPIAFVISNLIVYWTGWQTDWKLFVAILVGYVVFAIAYAASSRAERPSLSLKNGVWSIVYFAGMAVISWLGSFGGGRNLIPFGWDMLVVAGYSVFIYYWAVAQRLSNEEAREHVAQLVELRSMGVRGTGAPAGVEGLPEPEPVS
jgi:amino acid transporter